MVDHATAPPLAVLPPFVLPDQHGLRVNTAQLRGRRNLVLFLLPEWHVDALPYLITFATRREEWAWLHTTVLAIVPDGGDLSSAASLDVSVLRDPGAVRSALLQGVEPNTAAVMVADTDGRVTEWRTSRRITSLPGVDEVLAWAWEVARPRGACDGGVPWARPVTPTAAPPAPIGHFIIGPHRRDRSRYQSGRQTSRA